MAKTRHIHQRMSQRGIRHDLLNVVAAFGTYQGDRQILNRKACSAAIKELNKLKDQLQSAEKRGGFVVVSEGETEITTYALDSHRFNKH